jgi:hypothetical protein
MPKSAKRKSVMGYLRKREKVKKTVKTQLRTRFAEGLAWTRPQRKPQRRDRE